MEDNDHTLRQVLVDASIFIESAISRIHYVMEEIGWDLDRVSSYSEKAFCEEMSHREVTLIRAKIQEINILIGKISAVVDLMVALEKICAIDAWFDK